MTSKENETESESREVCDEESKNRIFVGSIPYSVTDEELSKFLTDQGVIHKSCLVSKKNGKSCGFGYVEFNNAVDAERCLNIENRTIEGKLLRFEEAKGTLFVKLGTH